MYIKMIYNKAFALYTKLNKIEVIYFLIGFSILISYYLLYIFRHVDKTVLVDWGSVFYYNNVNIYYILSILAIAISIGFIISKITINIPFDEEKFHIFVLFLSGLIIGSFFWNIPEINPDAIRYITQASYLEEYGIFAFFNDWGHEFFVWTDFPSIPFFYGIIFRYLGEYREYIQIFNTILFSLTSVLTYKISKTLWNKEIGLYSGFLLMSFPFLLSQIPLTLVDIPQMFLTTLSIYLILRVFDNKYFSIPASTALFFTAYTKITSIMVILPVFFILLINYRSILKDWYRWVFTIFFSGLLVFSFFFWKMDVIISQLNFLLNMNTENIVSESPVMYIFQIGTFVILLALFSVIVAYKKNDTNYIILIAWVIIPFLIFSNTRIRYMIPVFPGIAIMASLSLSTISVNSVKKFLFYSLVLTSIVFTIISYIPYEENFTNRNVKDAAEFTNDLDIPDIQLFLDFSENHRHTPEPFVSLFDFYSHKRIIYSDENKYYPTEDYSTTFTSVYELPSFYYDNKLKTISKNNPIIVIISDKKQSSSIPQEYLKNYVLVRKFEKSTLGVLTPSSVRVYLPMDYSEIDLFIKIYV